MQARKGHDSPNVQTMTHQVSDDNIGVKELDYYEIRNVGYLSASLG